MPNGQRRNRNSRHANTQRNLQNASVIEASSVAEIADLVVAAEEYVDNSDEIERLKSSLDSMRKGYARQQKEICRLKKDEKDALRCADGFMAALVTLRDKHGMISIQKNGNGSRCEVAPKYLTRNGNQVLFKDIPKLLDEQDNTIEEQEEEIDKLKTFCKSLITTNQEGIKTMIKSLSKNIDDDLVCDINYSDEEDEEDEFTHIIQRGRNWSYNKDFELYDADHNFIKKFDCRLRMMAHFHPKNKF